MLKFKNPPQTTTKPIQGAGDLDLVDRFSRRESGGTLGMVLLTINPMDTLDSWYLLGVRYISFQGAPTWGVKQQWPHSKSFTTIFPMKLVKPSPRQEPPEGHPCTNACFNWMMNQIFTSKNGWKPPFPSIKNWLFGSSRSLLIMFFASLDKDKGGRLRADILSLCLAAKKGHYEVLFISDSTQTKLI